MDKDTLSDADYLRDLAERLMGVPVEHGVDQRDCDRLLQLAMALLLQEDARAASGAKT